jgi:hypothetical protein
MTSSIDQAQLYVIGLRVQVRGNPAARDIVDRCLRLLNAARTADTETVAQLEAEVEELREELRVRLGAPKPLTVS